MAQDALEGIANVSYGTVQTLGWSTATDWDNAVDEYGVVHEAYGDLVGAGTIQQGYPTGDANLRALWPLYENSGTTANDVSGNGHDATYKGPTLANDSLLGFDVPRFDGSDDWVDAGDPSGLELGQNFSMCAWMSLDSTHASEYAALIRKDSAYYLRGHQEGGSSYQAQYFNDGDWHNAGGGQNREGDGWVLVSGDYDGSTIRLFVNGSEIATTSYSGTPSSNSNVWGIGRHPGSTNEHLDGLEAFVHLWDRTLSASEHQELYDTVTGTISGGTAPYLETATKSFSANEQPDLQNLTYSLNGESITLEVIGSPGTASEEVVSQSLGGASSYTLTWSSGHQDFRLRPNFETASLSSVATFSGGELVA